MAATGLATVVKLQTDREFQCLDVAHDFLHEVESMMSERPDFLSAMYESVLSSWRSGLQYHHKNPCLRILHYNQVDISAIAGIASGQRAEEQHLPHAGIALQQRQDSLQFCIQLSHCQGNFQIS